MLSSLIIAIAGIVGVMLAWVAVQAMWKNTFPDDVRDDDALAGRSSCGNCGCSTICRIDGKNKMQHEDSFIMNNN